MLKKLLLLSVSFMLPYSPTNAQNPIHTAVFAGGCFWCTEADLEKLTGVIDVVIGYAGGTEVNPTYQEVSSGKTSHREAVEVKYDPNIVSYQQLLNAYLRTIDPTDAEGSFVDRGDHYTAAIFISSEEQKEIVEFFLDKMTNSSYFKGDKLSVAVLPFTTFYSAEKYHQDYAQKNPVQYSFYRFQSGRDKYIKEVWDKIPSDFFYKKEIDMKTLYTYNSTMEERFKDFIKPSRTILREQLTSIQYDVTQKEATEPPFTNEFNDHFEKGIYVDIISGEPLFSSRDKFDSKSGWPSFTIPISDQFIVEKNDFSLFMRRTEVRSRYADSHLGHVFDDQANGALRYCMNSAALRFIPYDKMKEEGYGDYLSYV